MFYIFFNSRKKKGNRIAKTKRKNFNFIVQEFSGFFKPGDELHILVG